MPKGSARFDTYMPSLRVGPTHLIEVVVVDGVGQAQLGLQGLVCFPARDHLSGGVEVQKKETERVESMRRGVDGKEKRESRRALVHGGSLFAEVGCRYKVAGQKKRQIKP